MGSSSLREKISDICGQRALGEHTVDPSFDNLEGYQEIL